MGMGASEFLTYELKRSGPSSIFVMTDEDTQSDPIFSEEELGGKQQPKYEWRFKPGKEQGKLTYRFRDTNNKRLGDAAWQPQAGDFHVTDLILSFLFLGKYTLVIKRVDKTGTALETIADVDYEGESNTDMAEMTLLIAVVA